MIPIDIASIIVEYINEYVDPPRITTPPCIFGSVVKYQISMYGDLSGYDWNTRIVLSPLQVPRFGDKLDERFIAVVRQIASISMYSRKIVKN